MPRAARAPSCAAVKGGKASTAPYAAAQLVKPYKSGLRRSASTAVRSSRVSTESGSARTRLVDAIVRDTASEGAPRS